MLARNAVRPTSRSLSTDLARRSASNTQFAKRSIATVIQQGTEGWRLSLGRNPVKLNPGLRLKLPFYHTILQVDMREQSVDIKELSGFTSDNVPVSVSGSLFYRVRNSYDACFAVDNFSQSVAYIGTSAMRSVVGNFTYDEVIGDRNAINGKLHDVIGHSIQKWGVDCTRFEIQHFKPSNRDVEKQLELQMAAERERRKKILDTQAMVNVAEGHKQRVILESEGALQSQLNNAAGAKRQLILESEGTLEASKNEGHALAAQIEVLARTLAGPEKVSSEHKLKALEAFLELKRMEQLKAIAHGQGNATYFFGDEHATARLSKDAYGVDNWETWKRTSGLSKGAPGSTGVGVAGEVGKERVPAYDTDDADFGAHLGSGPGGNRAHGGYRNPGAGGGPRPDVPFTPPTA